MKTTLYAKDAKGQIRAWSIVALHDGLIMHHGVLGGQLQEKFEPVDEGLASRTLEEQIQSRFDSRVSKKLDSGYCRTIEDAMTKERTNSLGFARPMLAAKFDTVKNLNYENLHYQHKYDGCLIGTTKIMTDVGLVKIEDIVDKGVAKKVLSLGGNGECQWKGITNRFNNGRASTREWVKVRLSGERYISLTKNHKLLNEDGEWVEAGGLTNDDKIKLCLVERDRAISVILGLAIGDGHISFDGMKTNPDKRYSDGLSFSSKHRANVEFKLDLLHSNHKAIATRISGFGTKMYQSSVTDVLKDCDFPLWELYDRVTFARKPMSYEFLMRYFTYDTLAILLADDGSIMYNNGNCKTPRMTLAVCRYSKEQVEIFKSLFDEKFGVTPSVSVDDRVKNGYGASFVFTTSDSMKLYERMKDRQIPCHENKFFMEGSHMKALGFATIIEKVYDVSDYKRSSMTKYDIEVEDNHNYVANGVVTHNCRMLIKNDFGTMIAYSRQGKIVDTLPELLDSIEIPEGATIDGEIYCHGESLQTIVSWVKRRQENTTKLRFHAYDLISDDFYMKRLEILKSYDLGEMASVVPTFKYNGITPIKELMHQSIANGYEGLILRQDGFGYEQKRSKSLIKVKHFEDHEFLIQDIILSKDGVPTLHCITEEGATFKAVAPGSFQDKHTIYGRKDAIIGQYVHLQYANLTKDGKPFHPNAIRIIDNPNELK